MGVKTVTRPTARRLVLIGLCWMTLCVVLAAGLYIFRVPALVWIGHQMVHEDGLVEADAIVVLSGGSLSRDLAAATLHADGYAPLVVLTSMRESPVVDELRRRGVPTKSSNDTRVDLLRELGVPVAAIVVLSRIVQSTQDEAILVADWAASRDIRKIIVVTSRYHSARSRLVFNRVLNDDNIVIRVQSETIDRFEPERWWRDRATLREGVFEFQKLVYYRLMYTLGLSP